MGLMPLFVLPCYLSLYPPFALEKTETLQSTVRRTQMSVFSQGLFADILIYYPLNRTWKCFSNNMRLLLKKYMVDLLDSLQNFHQSLDSMQNSISPKMTAITDLWQMALQQHFYIQALWTQTYNLEDLNHQQHTAQGNPISDQSRQSQTNYDIFNNGQWLTTLKSTGFIEPQKWVDLTTLCWIHYVSCPLQVNSS